jgi:hypothetical protein
MKHFTQKYQLENVFEEEVKEITTEFMKYIKENYLKSYPINPEEKTNFEEASFTNQVWRDFMKQQLVLYNEINLKTFIKNKYLKVVLQLMDLQGIINEMEKWRPRDENIQNINKEFKRMIRSIKMTQNNDNEIPSPYNNAMINAGKETNMLQTLIKQINDRLHKYRIVINEDEKSKSVIDINEYLRGRDIGSISEFLERKEKSSYENKDIVSNWDLQNFYDAWHSQFRNNTKMKKLLNQQQFQNTFKAKIKEFDKSITFSQSITDKNMDRSDVNQANNMKKGDLEEETKKKIASFLENLFRFYYFLHKFLSNEYGIEFIPNFIIKDTSFSKKKEPSLLLKQKYLDRIVEIYNKLETDYQKNIWNVLYPPPKTTILENFRKKLGLTGGKNETKPI